MDEGTARNGADALFEEYGDNTVPDCFICIHAFKSAQKILEARERYYQRVRRQRGEIGIDDDDNHDDDLEDDDDDADQAQQHQVKEVPVVTVMGGTDGNDIFIDNTFDDDDDDDDNDDDDEDDDGDDEIGTVLTKKGRQLREVLLQCIAVVGFSTPLCNTVRNVLAVNEQLPVHHHHHHHQHQHHQQLPNVVGISQGVRLEEPPPGVDHLTHLPAPAPPPTSSSSTTKKPKRKVSTKSASSPSLPLPLPLPTSTGLKMVPLSATTAAPFVFPNVKPGAKVILLVAGLRPVKDVLFLADAVDRAWRSGSDYCLILVGGVIDYAYAATVQQRFCRSGGAMKLYPQRSRDVIIQMLMAADMVRELT